MGMIHIDLELFNGEDIALKRRGYIQSEDIRKLKVNALVDTDCLMLAINESVRDQLGLSKVDERSAELADGTTRLYDVVGPVEIRIPHRRCSVDALVLPGDTEVLLGAIPMEDMDLILDPRQQKVIVDPSQPYVSKKPLK